MQHLTAFSRCGGKYIDLIFSLNHDFKRTNYIHRFPIDLNRQYLMSLLRYQLDNFALSNLKRFIHTYLHLPHMHNISKSNNLQQPITITIFNKLTITSMFPQLSNTTTPIINVKNDQVLILVDVDYFSIDLHRENR